MRFSFRRKILGCLIREQEIPGGSDSRQIPWQYAAKFYDTMYETVQTGNMGGTIVYAVKRG